MTGYIKARVDLIVADQQSQPGDPIAALSSQSVAYVEFPVAESFRTFSDIGTGKPTVLPARPQQAPASHAKTCVCMPVMESMLLETTTMAL